jgi:hypothetical protein
MRNKPVRTFVALVIAFVSLGFSPAYAVDQRVIDVVSVTWNGAVPLRGDVATVANVIDTEATAANQDWERANKAQPAAAAEKVDDLFGKGLKKITKKNVSLYHIHHKNIIYRGNEYILNKKGMTHAGSLARILRPKEFEKMLTFSLVNHIRKNRK